MAKTYQEKLAYIFRASLHKHRPFPIFPKGVEVSVSVVFVCKPRSYPGFDFDNHFDILLDAGEGIIYENDKQVKACSGVEVIKGEMNKTVIRFKPRLPKV